MDLLSVSNETAHFLIHYFLVLRLYFCNNIGFAGVHVARNATVAGLKFAVEEEFCLFPRDERARLWYEIGRFELVFFSL